MILTLLKCLLNVIFISMAYSFPYLLFPERAIVRHSYDADNEDELSLKVGEMVNIISKEEEDPGWWKGELNGKVGVFPDNFVEIMHDEVKYI